MIFYRTNIKDLDPKALKCIDISNLFDSNRTKTNEIEFVVRKKNVSLDDIKEAKDKASDKTTATFKELFEFTPEQDQVIINVLE